MNILQDCAPGKLKARSDPSAVMTGTDERATLLLPRSGGYPRYALSAVLLAAAFLVPETDLLRWEKRHNPRPRLRFVAASSYGHCILVGGEQL